jgi:prolyl oligopeptidase
LIRIETNAGHGAGTPVAKNIEQYAYNYWITLYNMVFEHLPNPKKSKKKS